MTELNDASGLPAHIGRRFTAFMASGRGRAARIALGVALIAAGLFVIPSPLGVAVSAFAIVPIAAGSLDLCPVAPLWGGHFRGCDYRSRQDARPSRDEA